ncbi:MAG TPA: biotin/lipoyl-binding protein [Ignavibacteria bacterium]|nr:biotin/lipoyl-binding protein [Ignavibacteria bacterium]HRJ99511.1 biotin/lipoyl-binding protein [Ignavibacteria bacterium]HRK00099.1 biotin/lipoyl-binding protein [Ignavibacteria bacterium]
MKKFQLSFLDSDKKSEVIISSDSKAFISGKEVEYNYKWLSPNVMILRIDNRNYYISVSENTEDNYTEINLDSILYKVNCKSELDLLKEKLSGNKSGDTVKNEIVSPMPGIIKKLNVHEGQLIKKGDVLLVLEAMKMENEIKSKKDSVIKKVYVEEMNSVEKNELMILLG